MADDNNDVGKLIVAASGSGKGVLGQLAEIARLNRTRNRIGAAEYYRYQLYDDGRFTPEAKRCFLGDRVHVPLIRAVNDLRWWAVCDDKVVTTTMLGAFGAPTPRSYALFHPFRILPGAPTLKTADELAAYLRDGMTYPFVQKPVSGVGSKNLRIVTRYDPAEDELHFQDGTQRTVADYADWVSRAEGQTKGDGQLFQELLTPHPEVLRLTGPGISGLRVLVVIDEGGPRIIRATWKIIVGGAVADNFWRGNLLAAIDIETGAVTRVIKGKGPELTEVTEHPDTGETLVGAVVPHFEALRELVVRYAAIAPKVRFQGWDVAICEQGPVVLELNTGSAFDIVQLPHGTGLLDADFDAFITWAKGVNETPTKGLEAWFWKI